MPRTMTTQVQSASQRQMPAAHLTRTMQLLEKTCTDLDSELSNEINDNPALEQGDFNFSSASGIGGSVIVIDNPQYCPSLWFKTHFYDSSTENFKNNRSETDHEGCYPPIPMPIP